MLKPTAALRESLMGVAPCFKYDQKGSVTCTLRKIQHPRIIDGLSGTSAVCTGGSRGPAFLLNQAYSLFMPRAWPGEARPSLQS